MESHPPERTIGPRRRRHTRERRCLPMSADTIPNAATPAVELLMP